MIFFFFWKTARGGLGRTSQTQWDRRTPTQHVPQSRKSLGWHQPEPARPHNPWKHLLCVRRGWKRERLSYPRRSTSLSDRACPREDVPHLHPTWCRWWFPSPLRMTGQPRGPLHPGGYAAVNSYIIIKAAKSSSKRRNCQNKGCQRNFNSTSWRICLLMQSLITSSQPTFSSTRLLLHSGHDGQAAINEGLVNILFCPLFVQCAAPGIICCMPSNACS